MPVRSFAGRAGPFALILLAATACQQHDETTGSVNSCAAALYRSYNQKAIDQCMAVCRTCEHGVTTTCATSCMLKGAR